MTTTQIQYWSLQEDKRHNVATESEAQRHNKETEAVQWQSLSETIRHNQRTEDISDRNLSETIRHNQVTENISWGQLSETTRHNKESEKIDWYEAKTGRKNAKTNERNAKTNEKNAAINARNAATNAKNANTNQRNAATNARQAAVAERNATVNEKKQAVEQALTELKIDWQTLDNIAKGKDIEYYQFDKLLNAKGLGPIAKYFAAVGITANEAEEFYGLDKKEWELMAKGDAKGLRKYWDKKFPERAKNKDADKKFVGDMKKDIDKVIKKSAKKILDAYWYQ